MAKYRQWGIGTDGNAEIEQMGIRENAEIGKWEMGKWEIEKIGGELGKCGHR